MSLRLQLAKLAGARPDILKKAPGDITKHATMGGVLLSTSVVAGVSAFFALNSVLSLSWPVCLAAGAGWAVVILNLDRMLVVSMSGAGSTPLVLRIFEPEINAELTTMKAEAIQHSKQVLDKTYADIQQLRAEEKTLQDTISGRSPQATSEDPDVKAAQASYDKANGAYLEAEKTAQCELDGTCGTGRA
jgi:hypothetical protein